MNDQSGSDTRELDRIVFFSDAIFAIAMSLLVLDIPVPDISPDPAAKLPGRRVLNPLSISFVPFTKSLLGEYRNLQFAVVLYAVSLAISRLLLATALWCYATRGQIALSDGLEPEECQGIISYGTW
jgi:uncharacterized membrane protein